MQVKFKIMIYRSKNGYEATLIESNNDFFNIWSKYGILLGNVHKNFFIGSSDWWEEKEKSVVLFTTEDSRHALKGHLGWAITTETNTGSRQMYSLPYTTLSFNGKMIEKWYFHKENAAKACEIKFITQEGTRMYIGMDYYYISSLKVAKSIVIDGKYSLDINLYSTKEEADSALDLLLYQKEEKENWKSKKCLSYNDILSIWQHLGSINNNKLELMIKNKIE